MVSSSSMETFATTVNSQKTLAIIAEVSILDMWCNLATPLPIIGFFVALLKIDVLLANL